MSSILEPPIGPLALWTLAVALVVINAYFLARGAVGGPLFFKKRTKPRPPSASLKRP